MLGMSLVDSAMPRGTYFNSRTQITERALQIIKSGQITLPSDSFSVGSTNTWRLVSVLSKMALRLAKSEAWRSRSELPWPEQ